MVYLIVLRSKILPDFHARFVDRFRAVNISQEISCNELPTYQEYAQFFERLSLTASAAISTVKFTRW